MNRKYNKEKEEKYVYSSMYNKYRFNVVNNI